MAVQFGPPLGSADSTLSLSRYEGRKGELDWGAKVELYEQIRREYEFGVGSVIGVARKLGVHRRMVREAVRNVPAQRKKTERSMGLEVPDNEAQTRSLQSVVVIDRLFADVHPSVLLRYRVAVEE